MTPMGDMAAAPSFCPRCDARHPDTTSRFASSPTRHETGAAGPHHQWASVAPPVRIARPLVLELRHPNRHRRTRSSRSQSAIPRVPNHPVGVLIDLRWPPAPSGLTPAQPVPQLATKPHHQLGGGYAMARRRVLNRRSPTKHEPAWARNRPTISALSATAPRPAANPPNPMPAVGAAPPPPSDMIMDARPIQKDVTKHQSLLRAVAARVQRSARPPLSSSLNADDGPPQP